MLLGSAALLTPAFAHGRSQRPKRLRRVPGAGPKPFLRDHVKYLKTPSLQLSRDVAVKQALNVSAGMESRVCTHILVREFV